MSDSTKVVGVRPIRMRPLPKAMIMAFMNEYGTRILPELRTAILVPVTRETIQKEGLVQIATTNVYQPTGA